MMTSLALVLFGNLTKAPPNFVVILCDDLGIGDLSCYGNKRFQTKNIDKLASEGVRFTDFYVASPACTPSRAALLTGCYPTRVSLPQVLSPDSKIGLNPNETTLPEILKQKGYSTGIFGKWHLGVHNLMPLVHGFDEYFGLPYSNDMWPPNGKFWGNLFLYDNNTKVKEIKTFDDQCKLTETLTQKAVNFIEKNKKKQFFLYLPHPMPHVPLAASDKNRGKSKLGLYADTIKDIDDSVGTIVNKLKQLNLDKNTMVVFLSDNGPWRPYGNHAGSPGEFREGKGTTFEAGMRVPGIFWGPGLISSGKVNHELVTALDILPTMTAMASGTLPTNKIDGHDILPILQSQPGATTPYKWFYYFWPDELQAVRSGKWKLHVPHNHRHQIEPAGKDGEPAGEVTEKIGLSLYNLETDPGETKNVAEDHPDIVSRMLRMIQIGRNELGDKITKTKGSEVRAPGEVIFPPQPANIKKL